MISVELLEGLGLVNLRPAGNEIRGSCPQRDDPSFHPKGDVKPSWSISVQSGFSFCPACGKGWSFESLLRRLCPNKGRADALLKRAEALGVVAKAQAALQGLTKVGPYEVSRDRKSKVARDRNLEIAMAVWGRKYPEYMRGRGFSEEVCRLNGIGFDPMLRRVTFPIYDDGKLVGAIGRATEDGQMPKYHFYHKLHKGDCLYIPATLPHYVRRLERALFLVEGPTDALRLTVLGAPFVAAVNGAAMTAAQLSMVSQLSCDYGLEVVLFFDNPKVDPAGAKATARIGRALRGRVYRGETLVGRYPDSVEGESPFKDPGDLPEGTPFVFDPYPSWVAQNPHVRAA